MLAANSPHFLSDKIANVEEGKLSSVPSSETGGHVWIDVEKRQLSCLSGLVPSYYGRKFTHLICFSLRNASWQKWAETCSFTQFRSVATPGDTGIDIVRMSMWWWVISAILDFKKFKFYVLTANGSRGPMCVIVPHFLAISQTVVEIIVAIFRFFFQNPAVRS